MKLASAFFALLASLASTAFAAEPPHIELTCFTEYSSTSFYVGTNNDKVVARMINYYGMKFAPALVGVFTPNDVKLLAERAELVQKLNKDMLFYFDRKSCKKGPGLTFQCMGVLEPQFVNGAKVDTLYISVLKKSTETVDFSYVNHIVRLSLQIDGKEVTIEMPYQENECVPKLL